MKYMGSKARFTKELLPIILKDRQPDQWYVEPFAGGMNMICEVGGKRIANDIHYYLIEMWKELVAGWIPEKITKDDFVAVKADPSKYPAYFVGWVGFNCSFAGQWLMGFVDDYPEYRRNKNGVLPNYQTESMNSAARQVEKMKGVIFQNKHYYELELPPNSIIYCDPPYEGTTKYAHSIDHSFYWNWVRDISKQGHTVFVSEYNAPTDFVCLWEKEIKSSLSPQIDGCKLSIEKLFKYNG
jgi:DNA adenine methylase